MFDKCINCGMMYEPLKRAGWNLMPGAQQALMESPMPEPIWPGAGMFR